MMMMFKVIMFCCILLLFGCGSTGETTLVKPYVCRDISDSQWQWTYFQRNAKRWRGLWMRVNATGDVYQFTRMQRKFEKIPNGYNGLPAYLQTNLYENPNWTATGETNRQWIYVKTDPPSYGFFILPNGTILETPLAGTISFFPYGFGYWCFGSVDSPSALHVAENFVLHPLKNWIRYTVASIYAGGKFSRLSIAREVANSSKFPSAIWKGGNDIGVINETKPLVGAWSEVTSCLRESGRIYERYVRVVDRDIDAIPTGLNFVTLRMRDGPIVLSYPSTPLNGERDVKHYQEWKISKRIYVRVVLSFAPDGSIKSQCAAVYHSITGLV